jgi:HAMP domain-containing protein
MNNGNGTAIALDPLVRAKRAADIGDVSHTVFHSQEALIVAMQHLAEEVSALRKALAAERAPA